MKKITPREAKKYVIYGRKNLVLTMIIKSIRRSQIIVITQENVEELLIICVILRYKTPKETPILFHNGSTYDYCLIIKELAKEFESKCKCLGENAEKYITFSVPIKTKLENGKKTTYKLRFIGSFRFTSTSLTKLVENLSEIYSKKWRDKD